MNPILEQSAFYRKLSELYGDDRLLIDAATLSAFESDGLTAFQVRPKAVVVPETEEEIVATLKLCQEFEVPFVARGSGTSLSGGSLPHEEGIVIALNRMNRVLELDPERRIAVVQPGTINLQISKLAEPYGLHYAPDPSSQQICTIGGNLAFNAGGAHCLKYGMTSNHVLAARVVLADGELVELGTSSLENVGPDWLGLFVGSEGLMGVATQITVRLVPRPAAFHTVLAGYDTLERAGEAVAHIIASGLLPGAIEIMDRLSMKAAHEAVGAKYPENIEAVLIVELDGSQDAVEAEKLRLQPILDRSGASAVIVAQSTEERLKIWKGRKSVFSAVGRLSPDFIVQDGVVPRGKLGFALRRIEELSRAAGISTANVFHAGDGNLHPLIMFDGREHGALERAELLAADIVQLCIDLGGSITGEHGVGMEKRQFLPKLFDAQSVDLMRRMRRACDPSEIANRGKMFPSGEAPALTLYGLHPLEKSGVIQRV